MHINVVGIIGMELAILLVDQHPRQAGRANLRAAPMCPTDKCLMPIHTSYATQEFVAADFLFGTGFFYSVTMPPLLKVLYSGGVWKEM